MPTSVTLRSPGRERGAALITALIFLVVITMLSLTSMRSSMMELRMATNDEARVSAFQSAQSVVDATFADSSNTPVVGNVGYRNCTATVAGCDAYDIALADGIFATEVANGDVTVVVERLGPEERPAPRGLETSATWFASVVFSVQGTYDRADEGLGSTTIEQGVMVLIPKT